MLYNRFFLSDSGTLSDLSKELTNYDVGSKTVGLELDNDYLYIGQILPFNHLYFKVETINDVAAELSIDYWDGTKWRAMVDIIDETSVSGVPFAQSGHITWTPDKNYIWYYDDTILATGNEKITGLGDITIYDLYWIRIKTSANLNASTALGWVGNLFSNDTDLFAEYPLFDNSGYLESVATGKTDWEKQHAIASKLIVNDLKRNSMIVSSGQILDRSDIKPAAVCRTASVIYNLLGRDWNEEMEKAKKEAMNRLDYNFMKIDRGAWGRREENSTIRGGYLQRI